VSRYQLTRAKLARMAVVIQASRQFARRAPGIAAPATAPRLWSPLPSSARASSVAKRSTWARHSRGSAPAARGASALPRCRDVRRPGLPSPRNRAVAAPQRPGRCWRSPASTAMPARRRRRSPAPCRRAEPARRDENPAGPPIGATRPRWTGPRAVARGRWTPDARHEGFGPRARARRRVHRGRSSPAR
jgi:hypothetical protein